MAAGRTGIGGRISLDGEREFKQAVSEINQGLKVLGSEMALVTASYADNAKSAGALTEKGDVLARQIFMQREKVEEIEKALKAAAAQYGESDKRTQNWQISLNKAQAELVTMERSLEDNNKALTEAQKQTGALGAALDETSKKGLGLGTAINGLTDMLGIKLPAGADTALKALDGVNVSTAALVGVVAGMVTGLGKLSIDTARWADDLITLSSTTGIATDTLQELKYASDFVDVSVETMSGAMTKMIRSMYGATRGSKEASFAFKQLHISVTENGQLRDQEQMFYQLVDALAKIGNETQRDAIAMQIFGKSARELNPLIEAGSARLKELGAEARAMGYVMEEDALESFGAFNDQLDKFDKQSEAFKRSLAMVMLPVLTDLFDMLNKLDPKILATVAIIGGIAITIVTVVKAIKGMTDTVNTVKGFFAATDMATLKTTGIILGVVAALIALGVIIAVIIGKGNDMERAMGSISRGVGDVTNSVNNAKAGVGRNASGTDNWRGGYTWVGEEGPEIINLPRGSRVFSAKRSLSLAAEASGGDTYILQVDASALQEVTGLMRAFEDAKRLKRQGSR